MSHARLGFQSRRSEAAGPKYTSVGIQYCDSPSPLQCGVNGVMKTRWGQSGLNAVRGRTSIHEDVFAAPAHVWAGIRAQAMSKDAETPGPVPKENGPRSSTVVPSRRREDAFFHEELQGVDAGRSLR
jgi:hypothetical protein